MGLLLLIGLLAGFLIVVVWLAVSEPRPTGTPPEPADPADPSGREPEVVIDLDDPAPAGTDAEGGRRWTRSGGSAS
jgi:hypothetical protein